MSSRQACRGSLRANQTSDIPMTQERSSDDVNCTDLNLLIRTLEDPSTRSLLTSLRQSLLISKKLAADESTQAPPPAWSLAGQVECLIGLRQSVSTNPHTERLFDDALNALAVFCYGRSAGLPRIRLLGQIWAANPGYLQAYGLFRAACLAARLSDVEAEYPDLDIPVHDLAAWIATGYAMLRQRRFDEALAIFGSLAEALPDNPVIAELHANTLIDTDQDEQADRLYQKLATTHRWPAALIRLADAWFEQLEREAPALQTPASPADNRLIFLLSVDDNYGLRYLPALIDSLDANYGAGKWLLHAHLINPSARLKAQLDERILAGTPLEYSEKALQLPASDTLHNRSVVEARTYYACARFLVLPELLEKFNCPIWVIDSDMLAVGDLRNAVARTLTVPFDLAFIHLGDDARCMYEKIFVTLSCFCPTTLGLRFARTLAAYLNAMFRLGHWGWGLDQAAIFCTQKWLRRHHPDLRIAAIDRAIIADSPEKSYGHELCCFRSLIGSINTATA